MKKAIYDVLTNDGDVSALINTRIYPNEAAQDAALPYVVQKVTDTEPLDSKDNPAYDFVSVEVNCYAQGGSGGETTLEDLTNKIITALDNNTGTHNGVVVLNAEFINKDDIKLEDENKIYGKRLDFRFFVQR